MKSCTLIITYHYKNVQIIKDNMLYIAFMLAFLFFLVSKLIMTQKIYLLNESRKLQEGNSMVST